MTRLILRIGVLFLFNISSYAQYIIKGQVLALDSEIPLADVKISISDADQELITFSVKDGSFSINSNKEISILTFEKKGYKPLSKTFYASQNSGIVYLEKDIITLDEIMINTPAKEQLVEGIITYDLPQSKTGPLIFAQEPTHVFKTIPSVYQSSQGGGEGDSSIKYRGFETSDTRFNINGIAVNDMETNWIYWSNWSSIMDVAHDIKMTSDTQDNNSTQPSQGGQININTIRQERKSFTEINISTGSDPSLKTTLLHHQYNPEKDRQFSIFLGQKTGEGFVNGTAYKNQTYYFDFTKQWHKHSVSAFIFGAPQWHQQRSDYPDKMATLQDYMTFGLDYNYNYGVYDGNPFTWTENYFHKNINGIQWTWNYNQSGNINAQVYSSLATGGGTYESGSSDSYVFGNDPAWRNLDDGSMMWNELAAYNTGEAVTLSNGQIVMRSNNNPKSGWINVPYGSGYSKVSFTNKHYWLGSIIKLDQSLNKYHKIKVQYQYRFTKADNFDRLIDLFKADGYMPFFDINNQGNIYSNSGSANLKSAWNLFQSPEDYDQLNFHYKSIIDFHTLSTTWNFSKDRWSLNTNLLWTVRSNQRIDYFNYPSGDSHQISDKVFQNGWQVGQHIGFDTKNGELFIKTGWLKKPSRFDQLFLNYKNDLNPNLTGENAFTLETGYFLEKNNFKWSNVLYYISFKDRYVTTAYQNSETGATGILFLNNVDQQHMGWESTLHWIIDKSWQIDTYLGIAQWEYRGKASGNAYDSALQNIGNTTINLEGKKVGDAAQVSGKIILGYKPDNQFGAYMKYAYNDGLYAKLNITTDMINEIRLPAYHLVDFETYFKIPVKKDSEIILSLSVNNLLNSTYISTAYTSYLEENIETWHGVPVTNKVFFGLKRYGFFGIKYKIH